MYWLTLTRVGLILNTIGALALVIGSNKIMDILTKFVDIVTPAYGTYGQGAVVPQIEILAKEFNNLKQRARLTNYIGYALFIIGFTLQLF